MNVLIAPDKFKDALTADEVADAIALGVQDFDANIQITRCPLGDGGEGTGGILAAALGAEPRTARVADPLGRPREATWWFEPTRRLAIVEMAEAAGLYLLAPHERDPLETTTYGVGELIAAAAAADAFELVLCVGGSATVDGGAGCLQALGWKFFDRDGKRLRAPLSGGALADIARVQRPDRPHPRVAVLVDVDSPLLGPDGAAATYGPQKGARPEDVPVLEAGLAHWADLLAGRPGEGGVHHVRTTGRTEVRGSSICALPGTGAAGGLAFGALAGLVAELKPGGHEVARLVDLSSKIAAADLCITGEGRLDAQTARGKTIAVVGQLAHAEQTSAVALVGALQSDEEASDLAARLGLQQIIPITPADLPLADALAHTAINLRRATTEFLQGWSRRC